MVMHREELNKLIPDFATWAQCFTIYLVVLARHKPQRVSDLLAYIFSIAAAVRNTNDQYGQSTARAVGNRQRPTQILLKWTQATIHSVMWEKLYFHFLSGTAIKLV